MIARECACVNVVCKNRCLVINNNLLVPPPPLPADTGPHCIISCMYIYKNSTIWLNYARYNPWIIVSSISFMLTRRYIKLSAEPAHRHNRLHIHINMRNMCHIYIYSYVYFTYEQYFIYHINKKGNRLNVIKIKNSVANY